MAKKAYRGRKGRIGGIKEKIGAFNSRVGERRIAKKTRSATSVYKLRCTTKGG